MKLYLIRHSITYGNTLGRYIGTTDEPLCEKGIELLKQIRYPAVERVYVSPLLRCRQTAEILYPGMEQTVIAAFAECDFGRFENKNYRELDQDADYQRWIDSNGTLPFPGGESQKSFQIRCLEGMEQAVKELLEASVQSAALVVHGGTIMSILSGLGVPREPFYHWQVKNGRGYLAELDPEQWKSGQHELRICEKLSCVTGRRELK